METRMEKAASSVMGAAKAAKGTVKGLSGIFKTLMEEHGEVAALLMRVKASDDPALRARLFPTIRKELLAHEKSELAVLYPVYQQYRDTAALADHHNHEAQGLDALIGELHTLEPADPKWGPLFDELVATVQHHVSEEEERFFPAGERAFGARAEELDQQYQQHKQAIAASI